VILIVTTTRDPATDLGYLLHKHPDRVQAFDSQAGVAHVFYPEASSARCTAALLLEVDPVALVRGRRDGARQPAAFALGQYVNDRPYAATSLLAIAIKRVFGTALAGRCDARPDLAASRLPLEIAIPALPCRGGAALARRVFEPLGWHVAASAIQLDPDFPDWGDSRYLAVTLTGELRLADALNQLYVLLPVFDDAKHYWVTADEIDKLIRAGSGWLAGHPDRDLIARRYLAHCGEFTRSALARLAEVDDAQPEDLDNATGCALAVTPADLAVPLSELRRSAVLAAIREAGARRVADLGCGEGALTRALLEDRDIDLVVATEVSARALQHAAQRLRLDRMTDQQRARVQLFQSSLTYRDERLTGLDAAVLAEVIEHVDPGRLPALERAVFGHARPGTVIVTTPNAEYNVRFETLPAGSFRHPDHRFEWTRSEFREWAGRVATAYQYQVQEFPIGQADEELGPPTQAAVFTGAAA
jgi:3' terminal RNA ribose 2'-O-methyltransferase Hen1